MGEISIDNFTEAIMLQEPKQVKGTAGELITTYKDIAMQLCAVEIVVADEMVDNYNYTSATTLNIDMYTFPGVTNKWRILYREEVYNIISVQPVKGTLFCQLRALKSN